MHENVVKEMA